MNAFMQPALGSGGGLSGDETHSIFQFNHEINMKCQMLAPVTRQPRNATWESDNQPGENDE